MREENANEYYEIKAKVEVEVEVEVKVKVKLEITDLRRKEK
jgi:hypothetical protein